MPAARACSCATVIETSEEILDRVGRGCSWEDVLSDIKGIGPWTIAVFRIMVLRDADVLPRGDAGLRRAVEQVYGKAYTAVIEELEKKWQPFRSVACWYLWRTLGNGQLG
jgi:DNA-3-methyladenine glycosylase II